MHLTTLVEILERDLPEALDDASTRSNLARLYAERGCHAEAAATLRGAPQARREAAAPVAKPSRPRAR